MARTQTNIGTYINLMPAAYADAKAAVLSMQSNIYREETALDNGKKANYLHYYDGTNEIPLATIISRTVNNAEQLLSYLPFEHSVKTIGTPPNTQLAITLASGLTVKSPGLPEGKIDHNLFCRLLAMVYSVSDPIS